MPAPATMKQVGTSGFATSDEPLVPTGAGGAETIEVPTIRKPGSGEPPKPKPSAAPPAFEGEGPVGGDVSDDELLEAARKAASRGKKKPEAEERQVEEGKTPEEIEAERVAAEERAAASRQQQQPKPGDKETNLGNLRKMLEARDKELADLKAERDALLPLKEKETVFGAWEAEKTQLAEQVQKLSPYRDLFAIRENPVFEQAFILPVTEAKSELAKLAKDYHASEEDVTALLEAKDKKAVNDKLAEMFGDDSIPIGEARAHLANIAKIEAKRIEAEKKPSETLAQLKAAQEQAAIAHGKQVVEEAETSRQVGWTAALDLNTKRKEFEVEAFVEIPGNKEHNERRSAVLADAQKLHTQTVGLIVKNGGRVNPQVASFLATQAQLATVAQVYEKDAAYWKAEHDKLLAKSGQQRQQERPGATTAPRTAPVKTSTAKLTGREAAKNIWQQVMDEG